MQKKLIVLAIAAAMTVPALAYAEVSISGQANMSIDMVNDGAVTNAASANVLKSNNSRVVIKGSEDLGNGLSAMYFLDTRFNLDDGNIAATGTTANLFGGNALVGLKSNDLGTVMLGRIDSPYKSSTRGLDVFFDVAGDNRTLMSSHDARLNNVIAYASPDLSGFSVVAASVFGAEATVNAPLANKKGSALSLAGMYKMDNIYATLAYQGIKLGDVNTGDLGAAGGAAVDDESKAFKLGGGYTMDAFTVNAVFEKTTDTSVGFSSQTGTNLYIAGKFAVSSTDAVRAAYTKRGETTGGGVASVKNTDGANEIAIGYVHDMSKATSVYATYVKQTADVNFNLGADPSNLSFGVKHAF